MRTPHAACLLAMAMTAVAPGGEASLRAVSTPAGLPVSLTAAFPQSFTDMDGRRWSADRLRGRVVLLDFWATWCAPCLAELPGLKELRERYTREDFEIIGVMLEAADRRTLVSWLNRHRIDWPQVHERGVYGGALARTFRVERLPATVLFDRDGAVAALDLRGELLAARIDTLVGTGPRADRAGGLR